MTGSPLRIVVSGMLAKVPDQGGATWAVLQYVLGLKRLGHDVYFVESMEPADLKPGGASLDRSGNAAYFRQVVHEFGLAGRAALLLANTEATVGLSYADLRAATTRGDVLVNISGTLSDRALTDAIPVRIYLDLDPVFNQLWYASEGIDMRFAGHTHFVTIAQSIGEPDCVVPSCGLTWIATWQPVVLEQWPAADDVVYDGLTTVANWRAYGSIEHQGVFYGQKAHALREFMDLPTKTHERLMLALSIHAGEVKDLAALRANGWELLDPAVVADTPSSYRSFIAGSKGEFGVAKSGYVKGRCGWFSDRSACYLASGRPVLAQDTGFSRYLPTGTGLLSFSTREEAVDKIAALDRDYAAHCRAARALAQEHFDSDKVLTRMLRQVGAAA
jgi:hypothetical protein